MLDAAYQKALAKVGRIAIRTNVAGNTIVVDGVTVGTAPLARPVFVDPGRHAVEVRGTDGTGRKDVEVVAGAEVDVFLVPEGGAAAGGGGGGGNGALPPSGLDHEQEARPVWPALVLGGTAVVGVGLGLGFMVGANGASSDADRRVEEAEAAGTPCRGTETSGPCADAMDLQGDRDTFTTGSVVGFAVGGAATIGVVTYLLWPSSEPGEEHSGALPGAPSVLPLVGSDLWGARASMSF